MSRRALAGALLAAVAIAGCGGGQADKGAAARAGPRLTDRMARQLDATLRETVKAAGIPGASAAIVFPDGKTWSGAAGLAVVRPKQAMTSASALPFDSVTKVATAAMTLRLAEQGRLRLDDPIKRWYPAWRGDPQATVRELLGHTSGAQDPPEAFFGTIVDHPRARLTPRQYLAATPRPGPRSPTEGQYANSGFVIAGLIIERAARALVHAAMRRELFGYPGGDGQRRRTVHPVPLVGGRAGHGRGAGRRRPVARALGPRAALGAHPPARLAEGDDALSLTERPHVLRARTHARRVRGRDDVGTCR
jgi:CubicO group peptidase (beta-lactamase class C family)